jgi:vitamin B12 transporter
MDESFGSDPCFPGNPSLRPERSRTVSAGVEQLVTGDRVRVSANYFHNRYRDMISFGFGPPSPGCDFGTGSFFNADLARARGVLFSLETKPLSWLTLAGNYTFNDTRVLEAPNAFDPTGFPGNRLLRRPLHSGSFFLNAGWRALNFNLTAYFTGRRTDSDFQFPSLGLTRNPGYARFDLAVGYNFGSGISAYVRVANLFDKDYQDALGYPALGRDFRLGMRYTLRGKD